MSVDRDTIIKEIQRVAQEKKANTLTRSEFFADTGFSQWQVYQIFDSWREACKEAGLEPNYQNVPIESDDLFEEMHRVFLNFGGICTRTKFGKLSEYSVDTYKKRFGNWQENLFLFRCWLEQKKITFPFIDLLPTDSTNKFTTREEHQEQPPHEIQYHWRSTGGTAYGSFLNFRGLQHSPLNEQGVVFLFGMVCHELGFVVEAIRPDYPDCEAKRLVDKKQDKWERVRIEFEFKSSSFKAHGHKPDLWTLLFAGRMTGQSVHWK